MKFLFIFFLSTTPFFIAVRQGDASSEPLASSESSVLDPKINICPANYGSQTVKNAQINKAPTQKAKMNVTSKIWVDNKILRSNETLSLHFSAPNPPFLGVIDPDGHFFYIVFPSENSQGELQPVIESKDFVDLQTMLINPQTFTSDPYTYGIYTNMPVFTKSGKYTFIMGDNLHVHDPKLLDKVEVQYIKN